MKTGLTLTTIATLALCASAASAHVLLQQTEAAAGGAYQGAFVVPHGCNGSATAKLVATMPDGLVDVQAAAKPGWTIETLGGAGAPRQISWSGRLDNGKRGEFAFTGKFATSVKEGDTLAFPILQQCETGSSNWSEIAAIGQDPHALKSPAPLLRLVAAAQAPAVFTKGDIVVTQPWSRATPKGAKVGAAYLVIENKGSAPDRLVGASSDVAGRAEVHEMSVANGVMTMRPLDKGLTVEAGKTVTLAPNGYHFMLHDLKAPLAQGASFPLTLDFEKAGKVEVKVTVQGIGAQAPSAKTGGGAHDHGAMNHGNMKM